ncbi:hypothetical protein J437_LFUL016818 [Ladona fulva]|uniref:HIRA-interacting protein 3 n=1 Tax=Ladona fulva TaxID=123851 RepID=A0A8K0KLA0_LADFU|nr:hypothetical protein J437_LFUL016818 [Ladona fulva]
MNKKRLHSGSEDSGEDSAEGNVKDDGNSNDKKRRRIYSSGITGSDSEKEVQEESLVKKKSLDTSFVKNEEINRPITTKESPKNKKKVEDGDLKSSKKISGSNNHTERLIIKTLFEESESHTESSSSEAESVGDGKEKISSSRILNNNSSKGKSISHENDASSDETENSNSQPLKKLSNKSSKGQSKSNDSDASSEEPEDSDTQPLKQKSNKSSKGKDISHGSPMASSGEREDSDSKKLKQKSNKSSKGKSKSNDSDASSDEPEDSDSRPLKQKSNKSSKGKSKSSDSDASSDEQEDSDSRPLKQKSIKSSKPTAGEKKLLRMKRFVLMAGIRIGNYNNFFSGCKSTTAKVKKLEDLLEEKGLKGRPTIEKCKKLRKKLDRQREIAELDMDNIIEGIVL